MEENIISPKDLIEIAVRRKLSLLLPFAVILCLSLLVALVLPSIYKSGSTILIEEQKIPLDFVSANVTGFAEQRLHTINQKIMSSTRLKQIIRQFNLYQDLMDAWTMDEITEKMREDIRLEPISAETIDRRTGRQTAITIAFSLSYEGRQPKQVYKVANVLTSLFLEENLRVREQQSKDTENFLKEETDRVKSDLEKIESQLATFKKRHINSLPGLMQVNLQTLSTIEGNIATQKQKLSSLQEREEQLVTQIAGISDTNENADEKRLKELESQLTYLRTMYSEEYPDVKITKSEIQKIKAKLSNKILNTEKRDKNENPVYTQLSSQLASIKTEIESTKQQVSDLNLQKKEYRRRVNATPKVEEGYNALNGERRNLQMKYDDLVRKYMEAQVAYGLEKEQKGERFTLIDPAQMPEKPYKPNRVAIALVGFLLAVFVGIATASVWEYADDTVRDAKSLSLATKFPVLVGIPEILTQDDILKVKKKKLLIISGLSLFFIIVVSFTYLIIRG